MSYSYTLQVHIVSSVLNNVKRNLNSKHVMKFSKWLSLSKKRTASDLSQHMLKHNPAHVLSRINKWC